MQLEAQVETAQMGLLVVLAEQVPLVELVAREAQQAREELRTLADLLDLMGRPLELAEASLKTHHMQREMLIQRVAMLARRALAARVVRVVVVPPQLVQQVALVAHRELGVLRMPEDLLQITERLG